MNEPCARPEFSRRWLFISTSHQTAAFPCNAYELRGGRRVRELRPAPQPAVWLLLCRMCGPAALRNCERDLPRTLEAAEASPLPSPPGLPRGARISKVGQNHGSSSDTD